MVDRNRGGIYPPAFSSVSLMTSRSRPFASRSNTCRSVTHRSVPIWRTVVTVRRVTRRGWSSHRPPASRLSPGVESCLPRGVPTLRSPKLRRVGFRSCLFNLPGHQAKTAIEVRNPGVVNGAGVSVCLCFPQRLSRLQQPSSPVRGESKHVISGLRGIGRCAGRLHDGFLNWRQLAFNVWHFEGFDDDFPAAGCASCLHASLGGEVAGGISALNDTRGWPLLGRFAPLLAVATADVMTLQNRYWRCVQGS